jgi:uncharacterized protein
MEESKMMLNEESAFHTGEREIQSALGVREELEKRSRKVVRSFLPDQHRRFYQELPFVVIAARDSQERPWATLLAGTPGFVSSPSETRLVLGAVPSAGDALSASLQHGSDLGLLGIDLARRRRNRANGRIDDRSASQLAVTIDQSFGNCPRFIVPRNWVEVPTKPVLPSSIRTHSLASDQVRMIETAETFFLASGFRGRGESASFGMDASHRGGPSGFVEVVDEHTLRFPDYAGNDHFNTFGNLLLDDRIGLVFVDFERADLLQITGRAAIDWTAPDQKRFPGAQRLVTVTLEEVVEQPDALAIRWRRESDSAAEGR